MGMEGQEERCLTPQGRGYLDVLAKVKIILAPRCAVHCLMHVHVELKFEIYHQHSDGTYVGRSAPELDMIEAQVFIFTFHGAST
jgi:hypothetical protein